MFVSSYCYTQCAGAYWDDFAKIVKIPRSAKLTGAHVHFFTFFRERKHTHVSKYEKKCLYLRQNYRSMARILSIDYGKRRTGIAVTDPLKIIAGGLCTVDTPQLMAYLQKYVSQEQVERFVIGLPTQTNGQPSENQARVREFADRLAKALPQIPITFWDERFTSVMAHQTMLQSGIGKKRRQDKALVDEISATIILQSYMESL